MQQNKYKPTSPKHTWHWHENEYLHTSHPKSVPRLYKNYSRTQHKPCPWSIHSRPNRAKKQNEKKLLKEKKTGNQIFKLYRNLLTTKIQKEVIKAKIRSWQHKLAGIKNADPTLWQTYKITEGSNTKISVLQDTPNNAFLYTDTEKSESFAHMFKQVHLKAYHAHSPLQQEIECQFTQISETLSNPRTNTIRLSGGNQKTNTESTK